MSNENRTAAPGRIEKFTSEESMKKPHPNNENPAQNARPASLRYHTPMTAENMSTMVSTNIVPSQNAVGFASAVSPSAIGTIAPRSIAIEIRGLMDVAPKCRQGEPRLIEIAGDVEGFAGLLLLSVGLNAKNDRGCNPGDKCLPGSNWRELRSINQADNAEPVE